MEENNSPRKTRSGKLLGGAIPGEETEGQEGSVEMLEVEEIIREEIDVDVIDLTEDFFDVDDHAAGDMRDVTEAASNEEINGTITIADDEDSANDEPTGHNELNADSSQDDVLDLDWNDVTVDLTDSPLIRSNVTVARLPNWSATFTLTSSSGASMASTSPSTSGASMPSTSPSTSGASMPSTSASAPGDSLPSTGPSNTSAAVTCRICLDSQVDLEKEGHNLLSTVCGHIFCSKCLPNYIKERGLCPICRKVLRPKDFHQIFL